MYKYVIILLINTSISGCATRHCIETTNQYVVRQPIAIAEEHRTVLALSGGGSHGAWGAGFLVGWRLSQAHPRPYKFTIVTGVSTGALQATSVFLDDDTMLSNSYTKVDQPDIYISRCPLAIPFSTSLKLTHPLEGLIGRTIPDQVIDRVAAEGMVGRKLYVGTTNLDTGRLDIWDMTRIAIDQKYDLYRRVLLASAAIPLFFPPVYIDGVMHADGGVREGLFLRKLILHAAHPVKGMTVYAVVNGQLGMKYSCTQPNLISIGGRTARAFVDEARLGDLYRAKITANEAGYHFQMTYIPLEIKLPAPQDFSRVDMNRLYSMGFNDGVVAKWVKDVPAE